MKDKPVREKKNLDKGLKRSAGKPACCVSKGGSSSNTTSLPNSKAKKEAETRHQEEMNQMKQERKRAEERHQEGMNQMKQDKEDFKKELMEGQKELIQELMRRFQENQEKKTNKERSESRSINHDIHESQASNLVAESSDELNTGPSSGVLNKPYASS